MDNFIKHNLLSFRNKILNTSVNAELGRVEIAVAAEMLYNVPITRGKFKLISYDKTHARLMKQDLITDMNKLLADDIIPKIIATGDPTSTVAVSGLIAELASEIPQPKGASLLLSGYSAATQIKTMWDLHSILDDFSKSPRMLEIIFAERRNWRIEVYL